jgi:DNA polymerase type B, organellar and viral
MAKKYDNYKIYIHNMAGFDANFLLKILTELGDIKPIIHHGQLISINFKFNNYIIVFRDSLKILLASLRKLAKVFGVDTQKSIFPYSFVNENNLDYIGPVPDFKYFDNITIKEYNEYCLMFNN